VGGGEGEGGEGGGVPLPEAMDVAGARRTLATRRAALRSRDPSTLASPDTTESDADTDASIPPCPSSDASMGPSEPCERSAASTGTASPSPSASMVVVSVAPSMEAVDANTDTHAPTENEADTSPSQSTLPLLPGAATSASCRSSPPPLSVCFPLPRLLLLLSLLPLLLLLLLLL